MRSLSRLPPRRAPEGGFTLAEVLITVAILLVILLAVVQFIDTIDQAWRSAHADPFAQAEDAFESVTQNLSSATLNVYQDYADHTGAFRTSSNANFTPDHSARRSDLDFVCGLGAGANGRMTSGSGVFFVAPSGRTDTYTGAGLNHLLNAMGYLVQFGNDDTAPNFIQFQAPTWRWRLKEVCQPAESLQIFTQPPLSSNAWEQTVTPSTAPLSVLAENVVSLLVLPERTAIDTGPALAPSFNYDARDTGNTLTLYQLPPRVKLVLIAIDQPSADRLAALYGSSPPPLIAPRLFQEAAQLDTDLIALDNTLTTQKINHRIFQRDIELTSSNWSNTPSP
jgi:uncharacterized protein (TIGR02599 family)